MKRLITLALLAASTLALSAIPAAAQRTGVLKGNVKDEQGGVLPGVTVTLTSAELMGTKTAVTDTTGFYRFVSLPPGDYRIEAMLQGFASYIKDNLRVHVDGTTTDDFVMKVAGVAQTVTVTAAAPVIDTDTANVSYNVSQSAISNIPVAPRLAYQDVWLVLPGVTRPFTVSSNTGQTISSDPMVNSAQMTNDSSFNHIQNDSYENKIFIDGMDVNDPMSGQSNTQLNYEAIEEINVKEAGADAEFGNSRSAQMQVITKSGGNTIRGSVLLQLQPQAFNWSNVQGASSAQDSYVNPAVSIGGPILKDKLWYFGSWKLDRENYLYPNTVVTTDLTRQRRGHLIYTKATAQVGQQAFSASFGWDRDRFYNSNVDCNTIYATPEACTTQVSGGPLVSGRWNYAVRNNVLFQVSGGYNVKPSERLSQGSGPALTYTDVYLGNTVKQAQDATASYVSQRNSIYAEANLTYLPDKMFAGRHEFKVGLEARPDQNITRAFIYNADSSGYYNYTYGMDYAKYGLTQPYLYQVQQCVPNCGPYNSVIVKLYSFYAEDRWHPTSHLTINGGIRYEHSLEDMKDRNKLPAYLTEFDPNILNNVEFNAGRWTPRIGFSLSLGKNGVIRAHYGRYAEWVGTGDYNNYPNAIAFNTYRVRPEDFGKGTDALYLYTAGTVPVNANFNRDIKPEYNDEYLLDYNREIPGDFAIDVTYVHRNEMVSQGLDANVVFAPDGTSFSRIDPNFDRVNMRFSPDSNANRWFYYKYDSLQLGIRHNFTQRVGMMTNFTRFYRRMVNLQFDPTSPVQFVYANASDLNQSDYDYHWDFRTSFFYNFPKDIAVSVYFDALSGQWNNDITGDYAWNASTPRVILSNGRAVANIIWQAKNSYYAGGAWGLQGRMTDPEYNVNVRFQKGFRFGSRSADASIDFFNIFNSLMYHSWQTNDVRNPKYGLQTAPQSPRVAQINIRFRF